MLDRGAEYEAGICYRFERDGPVAFLERGGLARRNIRRCGNDSLVGRDSGDVMVLRRLIGPALSRFETNIEIGHAFR
jgi:hypothetical protein